MKRAVVCLLYLCVCLAVVPCAWAAWGTLTSTGTTTGVGNPSCAEVAAGNVVCAVRSGKNTLMVNEYNGSWAKWTNLAGAVVSDPSCTSDGAGKVLCAATATNGNLDVTIFNGSVWSTPVKVKAALYSAPSCAEYASGEVLCVARNSANNLAWSLYNGTTWSTFANLNTTALSNPSCTTDNNSGVICSVFTTAYNTFVNRFTAGAWQSPTNINIGGTAGGEPNCASLNSVGNVACFAKAYTSGIFGARYNGSGWAQGNWTGYGGLAGSVNDNANCTSQAAGQLVCGVTAIDNAFYGNVYNGSGWSGWTKVGGVVVGTPSCAPLGGSKVICTVMGTDNKLSSVVGP
jgi:hypothetical protein